MKTRIVIFALVLCCVLSATPVFASEKQDNSTSELLEPYIEIIEEVNQMTGEKIYIPEDEEENIYEYYKNYTMEEFKRSVLHEVLQFKKDCMLNNEFSTVSFLNGNYKNASRSIEMDIEQSKPLSYNSTATLYSTVFGTGTPIRYRYQSINGLTVTWPSDYTGYHFDLIGWYYSLSNNDQTCTVYLQGVPKNQAGLTLMVNLTPTLIFSVN